MGIVLASAATLLTGYAVAFAAQMLFGYVISRLDRQVLMRGASMTGTFFLLSALAWLLTSAVGAFSAFNLAPFGRKGAWEFTGVLAALLVAVVLRNSMGKTKHQRTAGMTLTFCLCIVLGCLAGGALHTRA